MKYDIFICYSRQDRDFVMRLTKSLDCYGYTYFVDIEGIASGDNFAERIRTAIDNSEIVLLVLSKYSNESRWVQNEITYADSQNKTIIPINVDRVDLTSSFLFLLADREQIYANGQGNLEQEVMAPLNKLLKRSENDQITTENRQENLRLAKERKQSADDYLPKKIDVDIFISYRRVDGRDWARNVMQALKINGYPKVFFDYNSIRDGVFNTQILDAIYSCKDFILIVSPLALKKCAVEGDWVSKEIREALKYNKKIIPIVIEDTFKGWPDDFPQDLQSIKNIQFSKLMTDEYFEDSIEKLTKRLSTEANLTAPVYLSSFSEQKLMPNQLIEFTYKVKVSEDCHLYIDEEYIQTLKASTLNKIRLPQGEYMRKFVSEESQVVLSEDVLILDRDKVEIVTFSETPKNIFKRLKLLIKS